MPEMNGLQLAKEIRKIDSKALFVFLTGYTPVSYTHLDVYKRQTQKWSTDTEVYSTYPYYNDGLLYPAATELLDAPSNSQYSSAAVSYTHLHRAWRETGKGQDYHHKGDQELFHRTGHRLWKLPA